MALISPVLKYFTMALISPVLKYFTMALISPVLQLLLGQQTQLAVFILEEFHVVVIVIPTAVVVVTVVRVRVRAAVEVRASVENGTVKIHNYWYISVQYKFGLSMRSSIWVSQISMYCYIKKDGVLLF
jgi:hypothetical protein